MKNIFKKVALLIFFFLTMYLVIHNIRFSVLKNFTRKFNEKMIFFLSHVKDRKKIYVKMSFDASHSDQLNLLLIPNFTRNFYWICSTLY